MISEPTAIKKANPQAIALLMKNMSNKDNEKRKVWVPNGTEKA
jgi:hypothetical protein